MNNTEFVKKFFDWIPEMKTMVEENFKNKWIEMTDGIYVIWGIGIMECIIKLLERPQENETVLKRVFEFIEQMVLWSDETKGLTFGSTFDCFWNEDHVLPAALAFMGEETRSLWKDYQEYMRQFSLWRMSQME